MYVHGHTCIYGYMQIQPLEDVGLMSSTHTSRRLSGQNRGGWWLKLKSLRGDSKLAAGGQHAMAYYC